MRSKSDLNMRTRLNTNNHKLAGFCSTEKRKPISIVKGYTLIELMLVIGIVIVLGSVSMGYYGEQVKSGYRSQGKNALMQMAGAMERFRTENNTYIGTHDSGVPESSFFPATAPLGSSDPYYNLRIATASANEYILTATPIAGKKMEGDGDYTLSYTGQKTYQGNAGWEK